MTQAAVTTDHNAGVTTKATTTVAMDFGRITISHRLVLFLFGTPGQRRFWFMWDEICRGAAAAVVLADTRRLADAFPAMDYFDKHRVPYAVVVNSFGGLADADDRELRDALYVGENFPVLRCDARDRQDVRLTLITVVEHAISHYRTATPAIPASL